MEVRVYNTIFRACSCGCAPRRAPRSSLAITGRMLFSRRNARGDAVGQLSFTGGAVNVVLNGTTAYGCGASAIGVIDISNPANPRLLSQFAGSDLGGSPLTAAFRWGKAWCP